jgi:hypothetical protein
MEFGRRPRDKLDRVSSRSLRNHSAGSTSAMSIACGLGGTVKGYESNLQPARDRGPRLWRDWIACQRDRIAPAELPAAARARALQSSGALTTPNSRLLKAHRHREV